MCQFLLVEFWGLEEQKMEIGLDERDIARNEENNKPILPKKVILLLPFLEGINTYAIYAYRFANPINEIINNFTYPSFCLWLLPQPQRPPERRCLAYLHLLGFL